MRGVISRTFGIAISAIVLAAASTSAGISSAAAQSNPWGLGTTQNIDEAARQLYGAYVQVGAGGGRSVTSEGSESGKGSGTTVDFSVGWRQRLARDSWQSFAFGATFFDHDERFQAPFDDLHVKPGVILYQSYSLGPNFPGFSAGQNFAPYAEVGIAEANLKVSADVGSATRWNVAPLVGGGMDYRLNSQWLIHAGVRVFFFGEKNYQLAPGTTFRVSDRATSATVGLIYQFDSSGMFRSQF